MNPTIFHRKEFILLIFLAVVFVALHIFGLSQPYHQDEYKWPIIVNPALTEPGGIPHPPVGEFIYRQAGFLVGYDNFRLVPFVFGFLNLFLLFYLSKTVFDTKTALWSVGLFVASFYSLLASLMVDTDGAVMPFFFLLALIGYFKLRENDFSFESKNYGWLFLLLGSVVLGFFVKASFIIAIGALALDFAFEKNVFADKKKIFKYAIYVLAGAVALGLLLLVAKLIFPFFNLEFTISYWKHFFKLADRGWFQTFIQLIKSILYTSPLLLVPILFTDREIFRKSRPLFLFMVLGLFFYIIAFDFSLGALDRYFQFLVVPLCIIAGAVFSQNLHFYNSPPTPLLQQERGVRKNILIPLILSVAIFALQLFNHFVPPLHPKSEWMNRILELKWNFLFPFTGGSGPTGFYVSFAFIALIWICALIFGFSSFRENKYKKQALLAVLVLGIVYNGVFIEEYLFGKINGSSHRLFAEAKEFIKNDDSIKSVVVYNDIGGYEIQQLGKYKRRLYAAPQFEEAYKKFFQDFSGHVLYINIPRIGENTFYSDYLNTCKEIYYKKDKYVSAKILDCQFK